MQGEQESAIRPTSPFNPSISLCRAAGVTLIILCHIASSLGMSALGQLLQTGVQLFLFISGFLYSNKKIDNGKKWIYHRFLRVCMPCYLWLICILGIALLRGQAISAFSVLLYFLNLQGYHYIFAFLPQMSGIEGLTHLWFITVIMVCYLLLFLLKRIENKNGNAIKRILLIGMILTIPLGILGFRIDYIWIYFAGYAAGKYWTTIDGKTYLLLTATAVITGILRIITKRYCDNYTENHFYLYVVSAFSYNALAIWMYYTIDFLNTRFKLVDKHRHSLLTGAIHRVDAISFYVYITHYAFMEGELNSLRLTEYTALNIVLFLVISFCTAHILRFLTKRLSKCFR